MRGSSGALKGLGWVRPPYTVTVYNRAIIQGLIYPYYEYDPTVTEWGRYPRFRV